ncbi:MAG: NAD(P)H-dependent glycerol-3-phosphate dehydrogenase [Campylobacterales bacterium]|nr:NAD(P)H-dependent glycerol-3-phosphate dehydrogenase [Campylobacterales bacterium]
MQVGVIGGGKWGQALHFAFSQNHESRLYSRTPKDVEGFASLETVLAHSLLVFALPAQVVREWLETHFVDEGQSILVAAKGIDVAEHVFLNEIFAKHLPSERLAFLSGPSFAAEVMRSLPTALVISSSSASLANTYQKLFPAFIKTYANDDVVGAEVSGAYKNVIAIASGICDGLELGNNARASLIARGLVEMARFGAHFGAKESSFLGLSGAGDLFLTASSTLSRNYRVGLGLARQRPLAQILKELGEVAEGVYTAKAIESMSVQHGIYTPIAKEVARMLEGKSPLESLRDLLSQSA